MLVRMSAVLMALCLAGFVWGDEASWKKPLTEKEAAIEANIRVRHNILGLYPSMVEAPLGGGPMDISTATPFSDIAHAVCWTSNYLAGASYRYRFLKDSGAPAEEVEAARARADEVFEAVYRCQRVTGVRGLQARGYFLGHGPVYEERRASDMRDEWRQGEVDGQVFRWRAHPSHHNYSDAIHGLTQYYDLAAEGAQKDRARAAIDALVSYWVDNDLNIYNIDRVRPEPILGFTDGKTLNTRVMMAIAGAKCAYHATGNEKFKEVYDDLLARYGVRGLTHFETEKDFDDAEHVFCHLENLFRIETDPELLAAYRVVADALWADHKDDGQSLFTYIYLGINPEATDRDKAIREANRALFSWPTEMTVEPQMNSLFPERKPPYPVYQAAFDNEYIWKNNLLRPDGWIARKITGVAVSAEDPAVVYAIDALGDLYLSRDGAATPQGWAAINEGLAAPVRAVAVGIKSRVLAVACDDGFYVSTTGGAEWKRLPLPSNSGTPREIHFDPAAPWSLVAVTSSGLYRSRDLGEAYLGETWENLSEGLPIGRNYTFRVAFGASARLYALTETQLFSRALDDPLWSLGGQVGLGEYARNLNWVAVDPHDPMGLYFGVATRYLGPERTLLQHSRDGGATFSNSMQEIFTLYADGKLMDLMARLLPGALEGLVIDPARADTRYAVSDGKAMVSRDGGASWAQAMEGLRLPLVWQVFAPSGSDWVFASTPDGLYLSKDAAATWQKGHLVLQFRKNYRRELGGAAFIDAYWRARHYGFVTDDMAAAAYDQQKAQGWHDL